ncbi:MAG: hypothetical protein ACI841_003129 [Planctomycetota bacterium]|jgi:hypothetical protein
MNLTLEIFTCYPVNATKKRRNDRPDTWFQTPDSRRCANGTPRLQAPSLWHVFGLELTASDCSQQLNATEPTGNQHVDQRFEATDETIGEVKHDDQTADDYLGCDSASPVRPQPKLPVPPES